ncbi:MAG: 3'(2'),5'-bisphosphate nucleotidase CysQ [Magnetococcales bacterium]|nr:3'(2'),5'-bisphosphate nucleotidase CysQ [Magnetococcales bacterium]
MNTLESDLSLMVDAAKRAGAATMRYHRPGKQVSSAANVREKSADNPLTQADLEADTILRETLLAARPDYGWLSEETADDLNRLTRKRAWVVDPIDGTKEFIMGLPQFAVSVGLVEDGKTIAGCVYNPAADELFTAAQGQGVQLNGQPVSTSPRKDLSGATCLASNSETKRGEWDDFKKEFVITTMGSIAYKLALVAVGRFDMTFTLAPKSEWDFCAGELLVKEAGGQVTNREGEPFLFNREDIRVRTVLASNGPLHAPLLARLKDAPLSPMRHK